jgi:group I intron endonuclease
MYNSGVYCIICTVNGKQYIGSAVNFNRRKREHFHDLKFGKHGNMHLQNAYNKYGEDAFVFIPILECELSELLACEDKCIDCFTYEGFDFNIERHARLVFGCKRSDETNEKIRQARLGKRHMEETIEKIRQSLIGNKYCLGHHWKLSEEAKEHYKHTDDGKEKIRQSLIGNQRVKGHHWKLSEEAKEHHRQAWAIRKQLMVAGSVL